jgi:Peptidase A4 family
LYTTRSLIGVAPLAAVVAAVLAVTAAGPAAASGPPASHAAVAPAAASAQSPAGKTALPGRTVAAGTARPEANLSAQVVSPVFTGYEASGGTYTSVTASWVQPTVQCTTDDTFLTVSISINGYNGGYPPNGIAEDLGTIASCETGTPTYSAYYSLEQVYSGRTYSDTVEPGDSLLASITYQGSSEYIFNLEDLTQGWTEDHFYQNVGAPAGNAEIGAREWPNNNVAPVDFGAVGFSATINGTGLTSIGGQSVVEDASNGAQLTSVSTYTGTNGSFMIFYGAGGNVTPNPLIGFEANYNGLWTTASDIGGYLGQMLAPGTSPSVAVLSDNGFEEAFQNTAGQLEIVGTDFSSDIGATMMAGTSPSIAAGPDGTFEVAWEAYNSVLWTYSNTTYDADSQGYAMKAGTNPAITAVSGGYEIAFQASTGVLWAVGASGNVDTGISMAAGTSPAIATNAANVYEVAAEAATGVLWTYNPENYGVDQSYGMMAGTSPAITALTGNFGFEIAFQANTGILWDTGPDYTGDTGLSMMAGTSPSITADPSTGFEVAFQAPSTDLWIQNPSAGGVNWMFGMNSGSSPSISY